MRALLVIFVLTAPAIADSKYKRKQDVKIDVTRSTRTKPIPPSTPPKHTPLVTANALIELEIANQPLRDEQAAILEKLVADTPNSDPEKPDLMFRLAEHYAQQLRQWRLQANAPTVPAGARDDD